MNQWWKFKWKLATNKKRMKFIIIGRTMAFQSLMNILMCIALITQIFFSKAMNSIEKIRLRSI